MTIGGAIAFRTPTAGLDHASGRPVCSWRRVVTVRFLRWSIAVTISTAACASRAVASSMSVWIPASMSLRIAAVNGSERPRWGAYSSALITSNPKSILIRAVSSAVPYSLAENLSYHRFCPASHPQVVVEELAAIVGVPARGHGDGVELAAGARQLIGGLAAHQHQRVARPRCRQPRLAQQLDVALGDQLGGADGVEGIECRRAVQCGHFVRMAQLKQLHRPLDVGEPATPQLGGGV